MPTRILVIEDHAANLDLMSYLLRCYGFDVTVAKDGAQGLEAARAQKPDLAICDVHLPVLTGYEVVERAKQDPELTNIPFVAVTALAMVGDREKVLSAGFDGYISKPINPETFIQQIDKFLGAESRSTMHPCEPQPSQPYQKHVAHRNGATILVVDNDAVNIRLQRSILEPFGFTVVAAASAKEAIQTLTSRDLDLIVSYIHLKDGTGFDLLKFIDGDARLRTIPFLMLSTTARPEERARALKLGARKVLTRPIEPEALLAEIEAALEAKSNGNDSRS
jgi:two-component system, cell cycle response regulator